MSGGVDSTSCALLLKDKYYVEGFFMHLGQPGFKAQKTRLESISKQLNIPLHIIDLQSAFEQRVLKYVEKTYLQGLTPNPCIICNKEIKFGLFLETILAAGMDKIATGHYAKIIKEEATYRLMQSADPNKDQTYFLSRLNQEQLARIILPLESRTKEQTYNLVEKYGFHDFRGQESQDICFLENRKLSDFLATRAKGKNRPGDILSTSGKKLGSHDGLFRYTIGQRRGLGISSTAPLYVVGLDAIKNNVIAGDNSELFQKKLTLANLHWLSGGEPDCARQYKVRIRYSHRGSLARINLLEKDTAELFFDEPQRAVTPGQFAVIYHGEELLGSGVIV